MKRLTAAITAFLLCLSLMPVALAAPIRDLASQTDLASRLKQLDLFQGRGTSADGTVDFALTDPLNRAEAVTMLIRAMGNDAEAQVQARTHTFNDVPDWADGYISYAYAGGLAKGVSDTAFGAGDPASASMYATLLLRALGYSDGQGGDFQWDDPWTLAETVGIAPAGVNREQFCRGDAVTMTCGALFARMKGSEKTLADTLIAGGVFTRQQFEAAFPSSPFVDGEPERDSALAEEWKRYDEELAGLEISGLWCELDCAETELCTVALASYSGGSSGRFCNFCLIYKPGSPLGVKRVPLPLPRRSSSGAYAQPTNAAVTADGRTLTYSFHFEETLTNFFTGEVMREAGTYQYTTDLSTGETELVIVPLQP